MPSEKYFLLIKDFLVYKGPFSNNKENNTFAPSPDFLYSSLVQNKKKKIIFYV